MKLLSARRTTSIPFLAFLALFSPIVVAACGGDAADPPQEAVAQEAAGQEQSADSVVDVSSMGFNEGDVEGVALGVVEFSDYGCVYCAGFHEDSYPALYEEFVETGEVLWKYIPISIAGFPNGDLAATAGQCGGEMGAFAAMRDILFEHREEWLGSNGSHDIFVDYAEEVGLDGAEFRTCLEDGDALAVIQANSQLARQIGVQGTPTFIVQGTPVRGAPELSVFQQALRDLVSEIRAQQAAPQP